jgi:hypothetical protein
MGALPGTSAALKADAGTPKPDPGETVAAARKGAGLGGIGSSVRSPGTRSSMSAQT